MHYYLAVILRCDKAVVLLCSDSGKRLEPVRIVCCTLFDSPLLHLVCDDACYIGGQSLAVIDGFLNSLVGFLGESGLHHGFIKDVLTKILFYRSHKPFSLT